MLNLFDYLTEEDNRKINNYIYTYGVDKDHYIGNAEYLKDWAENKKKLFHLLGGNLIYKIENFEVEKPYGALEKELNTHIFKTVQSMDFYNELHATLLHIDELTMQDVFNLMDIYTPHTLNDNKVYYGCKFKLNNKNKMLQISQGMKPMKALKQLLDYIDANEKLKTLYEELRLIHSRIINEKKLKGTLCLSIHPLDFITASHNGGGWTSCLDWSTEGCYRAGTLEMMNSNNVICAYLESSKPFYFGTGDQTDDWNVKNWRSFFVCNKDIILSGKSYPFRSEELSIAIVKILQDLAKKNWHQSYQFGVEEYRDMQHIGSLYRMDFNKYWIKNKLTIKHNIIIDTEMMYNDFLNDHEYHDFLNDHGLLTKYFCVRNKVKHNIVLKISGKARCLACGKEFKCKNPYIDDYYQEDQYNGRYTNTESLLCSEHYCLDPFDDEKE